MEEIDIQEKALTELFSGSLESEYFTVSYTLIPGKEDINGGHCPLRANWDRWMPITWRVNLFVSR